MTPITKTAVAFTLALLVAFTTHAADGVKRYLYMSTPDGAQKEGRSGAGILVFDIDNGHKFVKRIDIPIFEEGLRGFTGNAKTGCVYYSTTNHRLGCFNLETEQIVWEKTYPLGCDRSSITPDGKKIYVPTGWWYAGQDGGFLVVNGETGELIKRIEVGPKAHNSIVSLDGKRAYLGTETTLTVFNTRNDRVIRQIRNVGRQGVFPYTINSAQTIAYVCLGGEVGFDRVDLRHGVATHRVHADLGAGVIKNRTHGAGLTPDEKELWISDQKGQKLFIFDTQTTPPTQTGHVELSTGGHGWVCFSLDGVYGWNHSPDIFDVATRKKVATFRDENGQPFASSKFIEVHMKDGKVVRMGNEFGLGRVAQAN
ncbi:MAG: YncE family protein [Planctomycetota bacterium]|jgi:hypothetical protein